MILVLTGTHHQPFDRLVRAADALAVATGERVVVQRGASREPAPHCEVLDVVAPDVLERLADDAEAIVAHGGPGSLFLAWDRGRTPILVPRRPEHGEHVDDHQVRFAARVRDRAVVVDDPAGLREALSDRAAVLEAAGATGATSEAPAGEAFLAGFARVVDDVVGARRDRRGLRARLLSLILRPGSPRP